MYGKDREAPIAYISQAATQAATTVTFTGSSIPLLQYTNVRIGSHLYQLTSVSGSQSGYTVGVQGLDIAVNANTPVYYDGRAADVTVEYLNINQDEHISDGTIATGSYWTVEYNDIHDGYSTPGLGVAIWGGDESTIVYNCFSKMGDYAFNLVGTNDKVDYNEIYETNYEPDPGCGCSGGGKWWGTLNADIVDNAFIDDGPGESYPIWLDNGNSGTLISGNYFDLSYGPAISAETGYNITITGNLFMNGGWGSGSGSGGNNNNGAIDMNVTGGFPVPGSRYENQVLITNNQFMNDWQGVVIWQSGARNCEDSGEGWPLDAPYCSGGYPNSTNTSAGGQYYFSHINDTAYSVYFDSNNMVDQAAPAGSTTVLVNGSEAINDQIDFTDPVQTTTSSTTVVSTLNGSGSINAASTTGFPSSGQLRVGTSAAWSNGNGSFTGAILSYTGTTATSFTGVSLVRGSGTLSGPILQVQPYKVVSETCYTNDCSLTISPALANSVAYGTQISNAGTCQLFATSTATPTSPLAPDGISYFDGCTWGTKNISVMGNTFSFDPTAIANGTTISGSVGTTCTAANANYCGSNFMSYQEGGENPYGDFISGNAMMSSSTYTGCPAWDSGCTTDPLANINVLSNPPSAPAHNNEPPNNDVWSNNTYFGPWLWYTNLFGNCGAISLLTDLLTGKNMPSGECQVNFTTWQSDWQQDAGSIFNPTVSTAPTTTVSPTQTPTATPTPGSVGQTATITTNPSAQSVPVGTPFQVAIMVNGNGTAFNAAQATVTVSSNLTVNSLTNGNCNYVYTQTPTAQNPSFAGAILSTSSSACTVYTLTLTPNAAGTGTINFSGASVKAYSDSSEILSGITNGSYTLTSVLPTSTPVPPTSTPQPTAAPTPTLAPGTVTAGYQTFSGNYDSGNASWVSSTQVTSGASGGTLQSISLYIGASDVSPNNHLAVAIYSDNGSNAPGSLLGSSTSHVLTANSWNTIPLTGISIAPNTNYFLAFEVDGNATQFGRASISTGISQFQSGVTYGTWPNPFGTPTDSTISQYSIYMNYSGSGITPTATPAPTAVPTSVPTPTNVPGQTPTPTPVLLAPSFNTLSLVTYNASMTLTGIKDPSINSVFINGSSTGMTYPINTSWQAHVNLLNVNTGGGTGDNTFTIYGVNGSGLQTSSTSITISRHILGDIGGDGTVDLTDVSLFSNDWGKCSPNLANPLSDMS